MNKQPRPRLTKAAAGLAAASALAWSAGGAGDASAATAIKAKLKQEVLTIDGSKAADAIALRLRAGNASVIEVDAGDDGSADFTFARADVASIVVQAGAGADSVRIDDSNGPFTDTIPTTIDGQAGDDELSGGVGVETLIGGDGSDAIDGERGNDTALMGAGDDTFDWDPGDGSDVVEGQDGADAMVFNGAIVGERIDLSANGGRLRLFRDVGSVTMDTAGVERVDVNPLGGVDAVTVNDLTGTDVTRVNVDDGSRGGADGDGANDVVTVNGTNGDDAPVAAAPSGNGVQVSGFAATVSVQRTDSTDEIHVNALGGANRFTVDGTEADDSIAALTDASGTGAVISGLPAQLAIGHQDGATDQLAIDALGGNDTVSAQTLTARPFALTIDGGAGDDTLLGGDGDDTLLGGDGNDVIDGDRGSDSALMGSGDDTFVWDPGDGSDTVEGQDGADAMVFNGANIAEVIALSANGSRLRLFRDVGNVIMDTTGVERVDVNPRRGDDVVTVTDLAGTDVTRVNVDEAADPGSPGGDGATDDVTIRATTANDSVRIAADAAGVNVGGLAALVSIRNAEPSNNLVVNGLAGDDALDASGLPAAALSLTLIGDDGNDVLTGGDGDDLLIGGNGDDVLVGGPGNDTLDGGPGSNIVIQ